MIWRERRWTSETSHQVHAQLPITNLLSVDPQQPPDTTSASLGPTVSMFPIAGHFQTIWEHFLGSMKQRNHCTKILNFQLILSQSLFAGLDRSEANRRFAKMAFHVSPVSRRQSLAMFVELKSAVAMRLMPMPVPRRGSQ